MNATSGPRFAAPAIRFRHKMSFHLSKWQDLLTGGTQLPINTC